MERVILTKSETFRLQFYLEKSIIRISKEIIKL